MESMTAIPNMERNKELWCFSRAKTTQQQVLPSFLKDFSKFRITESMKSVKTIIRQYDKVILKTGEEATIVEIYEHGVTYEADIRDGDDYRTELICQDDILSLRDQ